MANSIFKLSVSKTATFQSCKAKYKYAYVHRLPRKEWEHYTFGRFVHRVLEIFHLIILNGSEKPYHEIMDQAKTDSLLEYNEKLSQQAKDESFLILDKYLNYANSNCTEVKSVIAVEKEFTLNLNDDLILNGMIDRIQVDPDGVLHVCDYKTTKVKSYLENDSLQLLTYAFVLYKENPSIQKVRVSYIMLRHDCEYITKEFSLDQILSIKDIYEKYASDILGESDYPTNPSKMCRFCDFLAVCNDGNAFLNGGFKFGKVGW